MVGLSTDQDVLNNPLENDDIFDALSDGQRRQLLVDLLDSDPQHVSALSDASRELIEANEAVLDQFLSGQGEISGVDKELIQKHHAHLPKLAEYGFIEWHPEDYLVTKGSRFGELRPFLKLIENYQKDRPATDPIIIFRE